MSGAVVSVGPVTATLPVAPGSVQAGVPPLFGAAGGHGLGSVAVSVKEGGENTSEAEDVVVDDDVSESEPHAASVMINDAAQATSATDEDTRAEITAVRLQPHSAVVARSPGKTRAMSFSRPEGQPEQSRSADLEIRRPLAIAT